MPNYAKVQGSTLVEYPYGMGQLYADNPTTNYGSLNDPGAIFAETAPAIANGWSLVVVQSTPQPAYNPLTQSIAEMPPTLTNGVWSQVWSVTSLPAAQAAQNQSVAAIAAGVTVNSTSTPAINGQYACDPTTVSDISAEILYIVVNNAFTGGAATLQWPLKSGQLIAFPNVSVFKAWASAIASYVGALKAFGNGSADATLPSSTITIA